MKFTCNQQLLSKALNTVTKAVSQKTTHQILKGILITTQSDGTITLSASNLDLSIEVSLEGEVVRKGSIVVSAKLFSNIIRKLPNEDITIEIGNDGNVNIKNINSEFNIFGQSADEFPNILEINNINNQYVFDKTLLQDMIKKTYFAASLDESKGILVGVLMEISKNSFNMVALDGFRMAVSREIIENSEDANIVVSGKILSEIQKILSEFDEDQEVKILVDNKNIVILINTTKISIRTIDGEFIKYKEILPKEHNTKVIVNRSNLLTSIERASLLAKEEKNNLIKISINSNLVNITSRSEEGTVKEELIVEKTGDNLEIGFNSKYLLDSLKAIDHEEVVLELNSSVTPCLIKPVTGNSFEYLVLPVRIVSN